MAKLSLTETTSEKLDGIDLKDGMLTFVKDTHALYKDTSDERIMIADGGISSAAEQQRIEAEKERAAAEAERESIIKPYTNFTATASSVAAEASPTVDVSKTEDSINLDFKIPKGKDGLIESVGDMGYYANEDALKNAHPTGEDGHWAIVGSTDTIWVWDSDSQTWTDSGNKTDLSKYYTKTDTDGKFATKTDLDTKQNKLTFDTTPTADSGNPVTSGGIFTALAGKAALSHQHDAYKDLTGILPIANGGTGNSSGIAQGLQAQNTTETELKAVAGNKVFSYNDSKADHAVLQVDSGLEKFQIMPSGKVSISVRWNDHGGTDNTDWKSEWNELYGKLNKPTLGELGAAAASHAHPTNQISDRQNETTVGALDKYGDFVITSNTLAFWNGAFSNTSSNLAYCKHGAFGTIVTKNVGDYSASNHTHAWSAITSKPTIPAAVRVKGNAESSYRTGDVNLTPANIGAAASNHTHSNLFYNPGDTFNLAGYRCAGYVGSNNTAINFSVPVCKPIKATKATFQNAQLSVVQSGQYVFGSTSAYGEVTHSSPVDIIIHSNYLVFIMTLRIDSSLSKNADACGIVIKDLLITFS